MNQLSTIYFNPTIGQLTLDQVAKEIIKFIEENLNKKYHIIIGSDSEGQGEIELVNAIVVHRLGQGGRYFWRKIYGERVKTLRQKIYEEVNLSLTTALTILKLFREYKKTLARCEVEIHVDIGEGGETKEMIKEIVSMIRGYGLTVKTKPEAYGATKVADRHL
ncbi:MAG: ribonuclease H-like YkuK family protein [Patescibacteria group bacterium]|nr:ribonuclease H-like YkuK family protein [Patescibacteria group bacterium]